MCLLLNLKNVLTKLTHLVLIVSVTQRNLKKNIVLFLCTSNKRPYCPIKYRVVWKNKHCLVLTPKTRLFGINKLC